MPLLCTKTPGNIREPAIGSLGAAGGGPHRNPARPAVLLAGKVGERDLGLPRARFRQLDGVV
jgi:hypothetical protein